MMLLLLIAHPALELELIADDPACPARSAFLARVAESTPIGPGPPRLAVTVRLEHRAADGPWSGIIESQAGRRAVEGESCAAVAAAAAVIVALQLEAAEPPPPPPPPPPREVFRPDGEPGVSSASVSPIVWARAALGVAIGPLSEPALALSAGGGVELGPFSLSAQARYLARESIPAAVGRAELALLGGVAQICAGHRWVIALWGCVEGEAGAILAQGRDVSDPRTARPVWVSVGFAARAGIPLAGPLVLAPALWAAAPLSRPSLTLDGQTVHRPAALGFGAEVGIEVDF